MLFDKKNINDGIRPDIFARVILESESFKDGRAEDYPFRRLNSLNISKDT